MALDLPPTPAAPETVIVAEAPKAAPLVITSNGYRYTITGNTVLESDLIVDRVESAKEPKDAVVALNQAYIERGYFLVRLIGEVDGTEVKLQIVQGRIAQTDIPSELARYFSGVINRDDLRRSDVLRMSALADAYAARDGMRANLSFAGGDAFGTTKMTIVEEPIEGASPWSALVSFNNLGNRYSSRYIAQGNVSFRPGGGVELTAGYALGIPSLSKDSKGSSYNAGSAGASIITPWGVYGLTYTQSRYALGDVVSIFSPVGDVSTLTASGTQLLFADETSRLVLNQGFTLVSNEVQVNQGTYILTNQQYEYASVGFTYNKSFAIASQPASVGVQFTFSKGLTSRTGTFGPVQPGIATPRFQIYQAAASYNQTLPAGFMFGLSLNGQYADINDYERLPSNNQWVLGGFGQLTAWYPGVVSGDSGYAARASLSGPAWNWGEISVAPTIFAEAGGSRTAYTYPDVPNSQFLSDYGVGLTGTILKRGTVSLAYAKPWRTRDVGPAIVTDSRAGLYFNVAVGF
jgi:hemolysin activation/secretion protein